MTDRAESDRSLIICICEARPAELYLFTTVVTRRWEGIALVYHWCLRYRERPLYKRIATLSLALFLRLSSFVQVHFQQHRAEDGERPAAQPVRQDRAPHFSGTFARSMNASAASAG